MCVEVGYFELVYDYVYEVVLIDLCDLYCNICDGLYMVLLVGVWMVLVVGFGGLCDDEGILFIDL